MWLSYAAEAGLFEVDFNEGKLGHVWDKPTTIGTNLPDLRDLQGLKVTPKDPGVAIQSCWLSGRQVLFRP